jgi:hypothetical protein
MGVGSWKSKRPRTPADAMNRLLLTECDLPAAAVEACAAANLHSYCGLAAMLATYSDLALAETLGLSHAATAELRVRFHRFTAAYQAGMKEARDVGD